MDRLQTMLVFIAVAEEAGFAAAARRLNMSPPSVTRAVGELEARLRARLLHRTTRTVRLTDAGARYLADCKRIMSEIEEADSHAAGIHAAPQGAVSLTGSILFGRIVLTPILVDLMERYRDISINTLFVDRVVGLIDEGIDIAVRIAELPDSSLAAIRVGSVRRVMCAAPDYLAARGYPQSPRDLAAHDTIDFVNIMPRDEWVFERDGESPVFKTRSQLRTNSADVAITAAVSGCGITRVLSYMVMPQLESGELEIVLPDFTPPAVPVHVVHKEQGQTSGRVRAVVDYLVDRLKGLPALK